MNKSELVSAMAAKSGLTKAQSKKALEAFCESVIEVLQAGEKVSLVGFGSFSVLEKAERVGVNPSTKQKLIIPARKTAKFKAGSEVKL